MITVGIDHNEKDSGCTFYQNALRLEIVFKTEWTSFDFLKDRRLISSLC